MSDDLARLRGWWRLRARCSPGSVRPSTRRPPSTRTFSRAGRSP